MTVISECDCGGNLKLVDPQPNPLPKWHVLAICEKCNLKRTLPVDDYAHHQP